MRNKLSGQWRIFTAHCSSAGKERDGDKEEAQQRGEDSQENPLLPSGDWLSDDASRTKREDGRMGGRDVRGCRRMSALKPMDWRGVARSGKSRRRGLLLRAG